MTEEVLQKKVAELSKDNKKGLTLEGFDKLIDYLVDLHKLAEENSDDNSFDVVDDFGRENMNNNNIDNRFVVDESDDDDENLIEIDTLSEFNKLSDGSDYIKFQVEYFTFLIYS